MVHPSRRFGGRARRADLQWFPTWMRPGHRPPVQRSSNRPLNLELLQVREGSPRPGDPSSFQDDATRDTVSLRLLLRYRLRDEALVRFEGFLARLSTEFGKLGSLSEVVFVACFSILALHLNCFVGLHPVRLTLA
jgi:hypothetical protein